jgi:transposase-like protein
MSPDLSPEAWAQIRCDYEHTDRPVEDICAEHGISSGTLRDRMRRWRWRRRRPPIPAQGPTVAPVEDVAPWLPAQSALSLPAPESDRATQEQAAVATGEVADDGAIVPRLQSAVARVLPAIEATVARLAGEAAYHPRETERAARALAALTRTLRELNSLLSQQLARTADRCAADDDRDIDAIRHALARRIDLFVASRSGEIDGGAGPQEG